ncbi:AEC family transporter [Lewinella sp. IMCC34183]|uniref:AEC family transporter n=1 Tax=Lewinella sp. IMCC34183 TaxID=2248762 RepID=UPI000E275D14|nr:AEC family transporter [Lewinella sp. IMCC34183]
MDGIFYLVACLFAGILLRKRLGPKGPEVLNSLIIYFFLPLLALHQVPRIHFEWKLAWLTIIPFVVFGVSLVAGNLASGTFGFDRDTKAVLILTCGIGSTSFVGFPIFEMLYGDTGLAYGILMSLGGTILVFNTVGLATLFHYAKSGMSWMATAGNILVFPPFLAFLVALLMNLFSLTFPVPIETLLAKLVAPYSLVAFLSIGLQVELGDIREVRKPLLVGQAIKLFLIPLIIYVLLWHVMGQHNLVAKICILGAAIGSMSSVSILAAQRGLNPKLALLMPAIGIPLSIPLLYLLEIFLR